MLRKLLSVLAISSVLLVSNMLVFGQSKSDWAAVNFAMTSSFDDSSTEARTSLTILLALVFTVLLRKRLSSFCRARFNADL